MEERREKERRMEKKKRELKGEREGGLQWTDFQVIPE